MWVQRGPRKPINGYKFSGKPYDPETGYADFGARFYDPSLSIWISVDPAMVEDGGLVGNPMRLSPYAYAAQSPMVFVDPDGREEIKIPKHIQGNKRLESLYVALKRHERREMDAANAAIAKGGGFGPGALAAARDMPESWVYPAAGAVMLAPAAVAVGGLIAGILGVGRAALAVGAAGGKLGGKP